MKLFLITGQDGLAIRGQSALFRLAFLIKITESRIFVNDFKGGDTWTNIEQIEIGLRMNR